MSMLRRVDRRAELEWALVVIQPGNHVNGAADVEFYETEDDAKSQAGCAISDGCYAYVMRVEWQGGAK